MSDSVQSHRWKPTRLPHPWNSPGKNTGVGCHFLLQCMKWKVKVNLLSRVRLLATPWTAAYQIPSPMGFSRQEYWSGVPLPSLNCASYQTVKNLPAMQDTQEIWVGSWGWENPLEKGIATHFSIFAWRIPRTKEPSGLQSIGLQRVRHNWATNTFIISILLKIKSHL